MKSFVNHESYYTGEGGYETLLLRQYSWDKKIEPLTELAIFTQCYPISARGWKEQLRWIWNIIRNKEIWADQIMLDADEMERLGQQLLNLAKRIKEDNNAPAL